MLERTAYAILAIILLAVTFWPGKSTLAHEGATGVVKERMRMMKSMAEATKGTAEMLKGKIPMEATWIAGKAEAIAHDATKMVGLFPNGSLKHPSEALPAIWQESTRFRALATQLEANAKVLSSASMNGDKSAILSAFSKVAKTCKSCHSDFRKKK